jgi:hypothetical protein
MQKPDCVLPPGASHEFVSGSCNIWFDQAGCKLSLPSMFGHFGSLPCPRQTYNKTFLFLQEEKQKRWLNLHHHKWHFWSFSTPTCNSTCRLYCTATHRRLVVLWSLVQFPSKSSKHYLSTTVHYRGHWSSIKLTDRDFANVQSIIFLVSQISRSNLTISSPSSTNNNSTSFSVSSTVSWRENIKLIKNNSVLNSDNV